MNNNNELLIKSIVLAVRRTSRALYLDSRRMVKTIGLSNPQCMVINTINTNGPCSLSELSRYLNVSAANMTGLIDRLEKKGIVRRNRKEGDRRITIVELTENGKALGQSIPDSIEEKLIHGLDDASDYELKTIRDAIQRVVDLLDAKEVADVPLDPDIQKNTPAK